MPLGISERCSARVEEFGAFADAEGAERSVFRLYVDHNDGAVFGDEGEANVYELFGAPGRPLAVKLGLRFERGGTLPMRAGMPREVRV